MNFAVLFAIVGCGQPSAHDPACTDTFYADVDGDGHGDSLASVTDCAAPSAYTTTSDDCDDDQASIHPGVDEICNALDDDCDLAVDEDAIDAQVWYTDADRDGFGDDGAVTTACTAAANQVAVAGDCADGDAAVSPDADELCNDVDDDCDGLVDSADSSLTQGTIWYADADVDGYGDPGTGAHFCEKPAGRTTDSSDCDDTDRAVHPNTDEICDGIDDDCDGLVDIDDDSLLDPSTLYADVDGDGLGNTSEVIEDCAAPSGYVATDGDCDDSDPAVGPAPDYYADRDGDGYGTGAATSACSPSSDMVLADGDCRPMDPNIHPGASEVCDSVDNNCDSLVDEDDPLVVLTTYYADDDGDGFGDATDTVDSCGSVTGYIEDSSDCADGDATIHPGAPEYCDAIDNDCDGSTDVSVVYVDWYADDDGDGYGDPDVVKNDCTEPSGYVIGAGDCDDGSATTNPDATEACANGVDDDCDGAADDCQIASADADVSVEGEGWWFADAIESADTDADGVSDLLVTAWSKDGCGAVYLAHGPVTAATTIDGMVMLSGTTTDADFGYAVDGGDENGDGIDDVVVGAYGVTADAAYLFLGPVTADRQDTDADAVLEGDFDTGTGVDVDVLPDFDGDGTPDLAIGALWAGPPKPSSTWRGEVYIVSGPASGNVDLVSDATYTYEGADRFDYLGYASASVGDRNGDGVDDIAMRDDDGYVYLVDGGGTPGTYTVDAAASASVYGGALGAAPPTSVDYDADGSPDLLVGVSGADGYAGAVYGFLGPLTGSLRTTDAAVSWIAGDSNAELLGIDVAAGDVDGDKKPDVIMGAQYTGVTYDGAAFLQLGPASGAVDVGTLLSVHGALREQLGDSVAMIPDWSGDGDDEVVIATPFHLSGADTLGAVYVFFSDGLAL